MGAGAVSDCVACLQNPFLLASRLIILHQPALIEEEEPCITHCTSLYLHFLYPWEACVYLKRNGGRLEDGVWMEEEHGIGEEGEILLGIYIYKKNH